MYQSLRMDPTQRMSADGKLTGIVADDDAVAQKTVRTEAAPQRAFGRDPHRVGCDRQRVMPRRSRCACQAAGWRTAVRGCAANGLMTGSASERLTHIAQRRIIDHVIGVSGTQQLEEIQSALAGPRAEPGEAVVADLRAEAILPGMPRAGIVHRDPAGVRNPARNTSCGFRKKFVLTIDQQPHHLPLRDG